MRRTLAFLAAVALAVLGVTSASAGTSLTLTAPAQNSYQPTGTPTFSGADLQDGDTVTVNVYQGSNTPVTSFSTQGANSKWSAAPQSPLPSGTYTAQATETQANGQTVQSSPVSFSVAPAKPSLGLSLAATDAVHHTATFSGGAAPSQQVNVTVYGGSDTTASPVGTFTATTDGSGHFNVTATGLSNGQYTAVASQGGNAFSPTLSLNTTSVLTMATPAANGSLSQTATTFSGGVDTNPGVQQHVLVKLSRGRTTAGAGTTHNATITNGNWQLNWPTRLPPGTYTATATQPVTNEAPLTVTHTFTVTPPGRLVGNPSISRNGTVTARLACQTATGKCSGNLLILTKRAFQPVKGGPKGSVSLLFRRYSISAGKTGTVTGHIGGAQLQTLKHAGAQRLSVTNVYAVGSKLTKQSVTTAPVRIK
ncbi:MAG: hypothetical protein J2O48_05425 [Solirubrobacterales bacterium]|nr:hypothetical protein [Solirubrobacterales bacterium]